MNKSLLNKEYQDYINFNLKADIQKLALNPSINPPFDIKELFSQIESKKKCKNKLPTWYETSNIYYPKKINIEQTSSEKTAEYKSQLVSGKQLIDITGGFGVDTYYFSKKVEKIIHCEINELLSEIVTYNFKALQVENVETIPTDGLEFLKQTNLNFDWIYIDPSRRHNLKGKVFQLKDCLPNVPENLDILFGKSANILIKTSPLLDLSVGLKELIHVKEIHIVAIENEVKELLWVLKKDADVNIRIKTLNILKNKNQTFDFDLENERNASSNYNNPLKFLYEPNSAIMKSGGFNLIGNQFKLTKLNQHSHLYTSNEYVEFPGRTFIIKSSFQYSKETMKIFRNNKANITTRNFPESVAFIRKKYKIKEGGNTYLFFTTNSENKRIVLTCEKYNN